MKAVKLLNRILTALGLILIFFAGLVGVSGTLGDLATLLQGVALPSLINSHDRFALFLVACGIFLLLLPRVVFYAKTAPKR